MKISRYILIFLIIFAAGILIRLLSINQTMFNDEIHPARLISEGNTWNIILADSAGHPPFYIWMNYLFSLLLGNHTWVFRFTSLVFAALSILFIYLITSKLFSKKAGIIAATLISFSAWHIILSTQIHIDGSFLMFFYLACFYFYLKYEETQKLSWLFLTGIALGLGLLTKVTMILMLPILVVYGYQKSKSIIHIIKSAIPVIAIGLAIFSVIFVLKSMHPAINAMSIDFMSKIYLAFGQGLGNFNWVLLLSQLALAIFLLGPFYLGLTAITFFKKEKKYFVFKFWMILILFFYLFCLKDYTRSFERYLIMLIPPLCIMAGDFFANLKINKKEWLISVILFLFSLITIISLNLADAEYLNFYPKTTYFDHVTNLDWNFFVPFTGNAGPIGFYVNFLSIAGVFIISIILLMMHALIKNRKMAGIMLFMFLGISFAYNAFITQEFILNSTSPNIDLVSKEIIDYTKQHQSNERVYIFRNFALTYYLTKSDINVLDFSDENSNKTESFVNSTVIIVDFPKTNKESKLWKVLQTCEIIKKVQDKSSSMGYIFKC